jgi:indolepyruvate ferredoxin oxidoreductase beta subunit
MNDKTSIVLTGVGGQGVVTAADILGKAALNAQIPVYVSEIHGLAQRGGAVICTVRMGDVSSGMLAHGTADALVSTEPIEALRCIGYVNKQTKVVTDSNPIIPFTVTVGKEIYPPLETVFKEIQSRARLYTIDAQGVAEKAGAIIVKNIVLLGALAAVDVLPFTSDVLLNAILDSVSERYREINKKVFNGGFQAIREL